MSQYGPASSAVRSLAQLAEKQLPSGAVRIRDILNEEIPAGKFVTVIGLVKDMRAPMPTKGTGI